jgi:hypothetical protein
MNKDKIYYLAGPMTGIPQFNFPAFEEAAKVLRRDYGLIIISPVETDLPAPREFCLASSDGKLDEKGLVGGESWGKILGRDVELIADACSGIILLPNWDTSAGARLEAFVGLLRGYPLYEYDYEIILALRPGPCLNMLRNSLI